MSGTAVQDGSARQLVVDEQVKAQALDRPQQLRHFLHFLERERAHQPEELGEAHVPVISSALQSRHFLCWNRACRRVDRELSPGTGDQAWIRKGAIQRGEAEASYSRALEITPDAPRFPELRGGAGGQCGMGGRDDKTRAPAFFQSFLTGASKLLISFLHHRGSQLSGRDQLG